MEIEIELYETASGHCPFDDWFESLRELHTRAKILTRLDRLKVGNFGDCKALGDGIAELRIHYTEVNSKVGNMTRRRPEFEPGLAGAEAAKLKKFSDAGGCQIQWLSDEVRNRFLSLLRYMDLELEFINRK